MLQPPLPEELLAAEMIVSATRFCKDRRKEVHGHFNIHNETPEGLNVLFQAFPSGDFFIWYVHDRKFRVVALIDNEQKTIAELPIEQAQEFQKLVRELHDAMEAKAKG